MRLRYFLDPCAPDGLRAVALPDCERYAWLWGDHYRLYARAMAEIAGRVVDDDITRRLQEQVDDSLKQIFYHLEICDECRAWLEALAKSAEAFAAVEAVREVAVVAPATRIRRGKLAGFPNRLWT